MALKTNVKVKNAALEETDDVQDDDDDVEEGKPITPKLVGQFIRMWPRAIFTTLADASGQPGKTPTIAKTIPELNKSGVYILYRDDEPYYVGQAQNLRSRLREHANNVGSLRGYFWNYFSVFLVEDPSHIDEVEAILIAAMPSVITNGAKPKLPRKRMETATRNLMRERWKHGDY